MPLDSERFFIKKGKTSPKLKQLKDKKADLILGTTHPNSYTTLSEFKLGRQHVKYEIPTTAAGHGNVALSRNHQQ